MNHDDKVEYMKRDLAIRGIGAWTTAPPLFRVLWAMGLEIPPPLFLSFVALVLLAGCFTAAIISLLMFVFLDWSGHDPKLGVAISAGFGLLGGFKWAVYYRRQAAAMELPAWQDYPGVVAPSHEDSPMALGNRAAPDGGVRESSRQAHAPGSIIDLNRLQDEVIESEYRGSKGSVAGALAIGTLGFLFFGAGTVFLTSAAVTDHRDIMLEGIPLCGEAASAFRWFLAAFFAVMAALSCVPIWNSINGRIALGAQGVVLPRKVSRINVGEAFVRYEDIDIIGYEADGGYPIALRFNSPQGIFRIPSNYLSKRDFNEVCRKTGTKGANRPTARAGPDVVKVSRYKPNPRTPSFGIPGAFAIPRDHPVEPAAPQFCSAEQNPPRPAPKCSQAATAPAKPARPQPLRFSSREAHLTRAAASILKFVRRELSHACRVAKVNVLE